MVEAVRQRLWITNWSSCRTPGMFGPGRRWTIMADPNPEHGQCGDGTVGRLVPQGEELPLMRALVRDRREKRPLNTEMLRRYREFYEARVVGWFAIKPEYLKAELPNGLLTSLLDGDTLCCSCSREAAARGECHRAWAAQALYAAGWDVRLDGVDLPSLFHVR